MGLDMYLYRKNYVQNWSHTLPEERHIITIKKGENVREDIKPERIAYITEQVAYWRKFNALHSWFVEKCGGGVDECQEIHISRQDLQDLLYTLNMVMAAIEGEDNDKIQELLPPVGGFFFGSTDIDKYYKQKVEDTIQIIEGLINEESDDEEAINVDGYFFYQASW